MSPKKLTHKFSILLKKLLLVVGSTSFVLLALEGVARFGFSCPKAFPSHHSLVCEHDPLLGWRHKANVTALFTQTEHETTLRFNSQGIRGPEYSLAKSVDEYRIVVLGNSFAEGYTVEFEGLFSEVLKQRLIEQTGRNIEVINFGVGGYSTDQELLLYQHKVKHYQPDLTVLMFHDNDVWFNSVTHYTAWGRGHKPLFRIDNGHPVLTNVPVPQPTRPQYNRRDRIKAVLNDNSHLYRWVKHRIKNSAKLYSLVVALKLADPPYDRDSKLVPKEFGVFRRAYSPEIHAAWEITRALLAKLKQETDAIGSELLVFYVPTRAAVYADQWEKMKQYYSMADGAWNIEQVGQELNSILERLEIKFLNPMEQMRHREKNLAHRGYALYFQIDGHWSSKGHHFAGEILAEYVIAHCGVINRQRC